MQSTSCERYAGEDYTERVCDPWLPRQVDSAHQVCLYDDVRVGWTEPRQGRTSRSHGRLLWQRLCTSLSKVRQQ